MAKGTAGNRSPPAATLDSTEPPSEKQKKTGTLLQNKKRLPTNGNMFASFVHDTRRGPDRKQTRIYIYRYTLTYKCTNTV